MVQQVPFEIPPDFLSGLTSGDLILSLGIRNGAGRFVAHLPEAVMSAPTVEGSLETAVRQFSKNATRNSLLLGLGVGLVVAGVSFGAALRKEMREGEKAQQSLKREEQGAIETYNSSLSAYLIAIQSGTLTPDILDNLIAALDTTKRLTQEGNITIEFTREQSESLVKIAYDFTLTFGEANGVEFKGIAPPTPHSVESSIDELRQYLELQKEVFRRSK